MSQADVEARPPTFQSTAADPRARGVEFGESNREQIRATVDHYRELFAGPAGLREEQVARLAAQALVAIDAWAPEIAEEIRGMALGSALPLEHLVGVNARTEILAASTARLRGECSTVVHLGNREADFPEAQQNWDWYSRFAEDWLIWSFETAEGVTVETLTEYGIVAKAGCNSEGVGVLFNILHHVDDGAGMAVPVHVVARKLLESSRDVAEALQLIASAPLSASTTMTVVSGGSAGKVAVSVELSPNNLGFCFPDESGLLVHTNHFLSDDLRTGDLEHRQHPDTVLRYDALSRAIRLNAEAPIREAMTAALSSRVGGPFAVCCRPDSSQPPEFQFGTLAHLRLDLESGRVIATQGGSAAA